MTRTYPQEEADARRPKGGLTRTEGSAALCSQDDCANILRARGLCITHYNKLRYDTQTTGDICAVSDCQKFSKAHTYCSRHYKALRVWRNVEKRLADLKGTDA